MSYGLQIIGSHGAVQIDQDYSNFLRIAQGSSAGTYVDITLPAQIGGVIPQLFVRPWADGTYVGGIWWQSATLVRIVSNGGFDWVAYGNNSATQLDASTYGLQVLDPTGALQFDSRYEPARIQATILITQSVDGFGDTTYPFDSAIPGGGWGLRPWICANPLFSLAGDTAVLGHFATTVGTTTIRNHLAEMDGSSQSIATFTIPVGGRRPFAGANTDIAVLRRYTD